MKVLAGWLASGAAVHLTIARPYPALPQVTVEGVEVLAGMASMAVLNLTGCHSITPRGRALVAGLLESPLSP